MPQLEELLNRIRVVLVRPSHPGNVGATARAMRTMGLTRLYLVEPERFPHAEARAMASNAGDVLDAATVCRSIDDALGDTAVQVAYTARERALSHVALNVRDASESLVAWMMNARPVDGGSSQQVALVFGNETYGLSNVEVLKCTRAAFIPTDPASASLNLAAAVQVAAYEVRVALANAALGSGVVETGDGPPLATQAEVERFYEHLERSLYQSGFLQEGNPRRLMERIRRLFARAGLAPEEVNILRGMLSVWDGHSVKSRDSLS